MTYCKVTHESASCSYNGRNLAVRTESPLGTQISQIRLDIVNCPRCEKAFVINPKSPLTKNLGRNSLEVTLGIGHSLKRKRQPANYFPDSVDEEVSDQDPSDLDYVNSSGKRTSMEMRLTRAPYEHVHQGESLSTAQDASDPHGLKEKAYLSFRREAKKSTGRDQSSAMKAHYENRAIGGSVPAPTKIRSDDNPHVLIAKNAGYNATKIARYYDPTQKADFEWCHVQADSLGGVNSRENLFCGSKACNTFMLALEDIVRENDDVQAQVSTFYEAKPIAGRGPIRSSSRLAPAYVRYTLSKGSKSTCYLISARCHYFSREDREAVFKHVKKRIPTIKVPSN